MIQYRTVEHVYHLIPQQTSFQYFTFEPWSDWRVIGGGAHVAWTNLGTGNSTCYYTPVASMIHPAYGDQGEDAWHTAGRWSNTNRTQAAVIIRVLLTREVPDPEPEVPEPEPPTEEPSPDPDPDPEEPPIEPTGR